MYLVALIETNKNHDCEYVMSMLQGKWNKLLPRTSCCLVKSEDSYNHIAKMSQVVLSKFVFAKFGTNQRTVTVQLNLDLSTFTS